MKRIIAVFFLFGAFSLFAQNMNVTVGKQEEVYKGSKYKARVDFISNSPALIIDENNGEKIEAPVKKDGKYIYTCICDTRDANKFGFNISLKGSTAKRDVAVFLEEGNWMEYLVDVDNSSVQIRVDKDESLTVVPIENTAKVIISCKDEKLKVKGNHGEPVKGPVKNEVGTFTYEVIYDLSNPEDRALERIVQLSVPGMNRPIDYKVEGLGPKVGIELAVLVIKESCYLDQVSQAQNYTLKGNYLGAYHIYKNLLEGDLCDDKPKDPTADEKKKAELEYLAKVLIKAQQEYTKAETFQAQGEWQDARKHHEEAHKCRRVILKSNPSDVYCLEYNRKYDAFQAIAPRTVEGIICDKTRMDVNNKHLPLANAFIVLQAHERDTKTVGGIKVPAAGKVIKGQEKLLGQSDEQGHFSVSVPHNTNEIIYKICFTTSEGFKSSVYGFEYMPTDQKYTGGLKVLIAPKRINIQR
ncbi:hypothetical protein [Bacteroides sp. 224]|uniref:hypothetical protein n=1 Tax=Bacteroides sp. 224 TaxID=2302936 RepID=UPI0013D3F4F3|nr:hypothetical protein [Bacteroides sp. 224]NDV65262.1 hypothetical protein [Bacteroides sp. 224]